MIISVLIIPIKVQELVMMTKQDWWFVPDNDHIEIITDLSSSLFNSSTQPLVFTLYWILLFHKDNSPSRAGYNKPLYCLLENSDL